jgi:uncharacterized protein (DUF433 family)
VAGIGEKPKKGEPFSVRFALATDRAVEHEARRARRSKSSIVEALAEEAMRTRRFPGIAFRGEDAARRPWLIGTGLDVWEICQMVDEFTSIKQLVADTQLGERQIRLALAYREQYPDEVERAISENTRPTAEWSELYPFVRVPASAG